MPIVREYYKGKKNVYVEIEPKREKKPAHADRGMSPRELNKMNKGGWIRGKRGGMYRIENGKKVYKR